MLDNGIVLYKCYIFQITFTVQYSMSMIMDTYNPSNTIQKERVTTHTAHGCSIVPSARKSEVS